MRVVSTCPLPVTSFIWQPQPSGWALTVVCRATFLLLPGESVLAPDQEDPVEHDDHWNDDVGRSLRVASDLVPMKPRADVTLVGHAFAPGHVPVRSLIARLTVGEVDKAIEVCADRGFDPDGTLHEGPLFARMPLLYERAAGGPGTSNPIGIPGELTPHRRSAVANLQPPGLQITRASDRIEPVGFGPIPPSWPLRHEKRGRSAPDAAPLDLTTRPLAADIDPAYFNHAPLDQQPSRLGEDEQIVLENLHPEHPRFVTRLPGLRPRATVEREGGAEVVPLRCDTLWIDTDRGLCALTWRAQVALRHPEEPGRVVISLDSSELRATPPPAGSPRPHSAPSPAVARPASPAPRAPSAPAAPFATKLPSPPRLPSSPAPTAFSTPQPGQSVLGNSSTSDAPRLPPPPAQLRSEPRAPAPPPIDREGPGSMPQGSAPPIAPSSRGPAGTAPPSAIDSRSTAEPGGKEPAPLASRSGVRRAVQLVWFDPEIGWRIRGEAEFQPLLAALPERASDSGARSLARDPVESEGRREVFEVLARGPIADEPALNEALFHAVGDDGKLVPPLLVLRGEVRFPFDELSRLKATSSIAAALANDEAPLALAIGEAREFLRNADPLSSPVMIEALTARIHDALSRTRKAGAAASMDDQIERVLVAKRCYQRRDVFGGPHVRAELQLSPGSAPWPLYVPEAAATRLPLFARFSARVLAEATLQEDQSETHPSSLRAWALARIATAPERPVRLAPG